MPDYDNSILLPKYLKISTKNSRHLQYGATIKVTTKYSVTQRSKWTS